MVKTLLKRAALRATVTVGGFQRRAGHQVPRYADFWRRVAGYAAYALAGERFVPELNAGLATPELSPPATEPPGAVPEPPPAAGLPRLVGDHLDRYVHSPPSGQNAVDIFSGEWSSKLADPLGV